MTNHVGCAMTYGFGFPCLFFFRGLSKDISQSINVLYKTELISALKANTSILK